MAKEVIPPYWDLSLVTEEYVYLSLIYSKIQHVGYYQCCILIGWATTRLYVIAH